MTKVSSNNFDSEPLGFLDPYKLSVDQGAPKAFSKSLNDQGRTLALITGPIYAPPLVTSPTAPPLGGTKASQQRSSVIHKLLFDTSSSLRHAANHVFESVGAKFGLSALSEQEQKVLRQAINANLETLRDARSEWSPQQKQDFADRIASALGLFRTSKASNPARDFQNNFQRALAEVGEQSRVVPKGLDEPGEGGALEPDLPETVQINPDDVTRLMDENPNLTEKQARDILSGEQYRDSGTTGRNAARVDNVSDWRDGISDPNKRTLDDLFRRNEIVEDIDKIFITDHMRADPGLLPQDAMRIYFQESLGPKDTAWREGMNTDAQGSFTKAFRKNDIFNPGAKLYISNLYKNQGQTPTQAVQQYLAERETNPDFFRFAPDPDTRPRTPDLSFDDWRQGLPESVQTVLDAAILTYDIKDPSDLRAIGHWFRQHKYQTNMIQPQLRDYIEDELRLVPRVDLAAIGSKQAVKLMALMKENNMALSEFCVGSGAIAEDRCSSRFDRRAGDGASEIFAAA